MLARFEHLLVPVEFGHSNRETLEIAFSIELTVAYTPEDRPRLTLLHVVQEIDADDGDDETEAFYQRLEARAATEMEAMAQRFAEAGITVDCRVRRGRPAREIVRFADEHGIDLIVMSSHQIDPDDPVRSWATVSYQVSVGCRCPVLLVK